MGMTAMDRSCEMKLTGIVLASARVQKQNSFISGFTSKVQLGTQSKSDSFHA